MSRVEFTIYGEPMGKQRPRTTCVNGVVHTYTPEKTTNYESRVAYEYSQFHEGIAFQRDEPIKVTIIAYFGLTKGDYGKKGLNKSGKEKLFNVYATKHLDIDNIIKVILDSLNGVCFYDDKQVCCIESSKVYTDGSPRVYVRLESVRENV